MYRLHGFCQSGYTFKVAFLRRPVPWRAQATEMGEGDEVAGRYPHIEAWLARLRALPGSASPYDVLPGERLLPKW